MSTFSGLMYSDTGISWSSVFFFAFRYLMIFIIGVRIVWARMIKMRRRPNAATPARSTIAFSSRYAYDLLLLSTKKNITEQQ